MPEEQEHAGTSHVSDSIGRIIFTGLFDFFFAPVAVNPTWSKLRKAFHCIAISPADFLSLKSLFCHMSVEKAIHVLGIARNLWTLFNTIVGL